MSNWRFDLGTGLNLSEYRGYSIEFCTAVCMDLILKLSLKFMIIIRRRQIS